jgi:hypothetical protein
MKNDLIHDSSNEYCTLYFQEAHVEIEKEIENIKDILSLDK